MHISFRNILIVEDDKDLAGILVEQLSLEPIFRVLHVEKISQVLAFLQKNLIEIVLLGSDLPDMESRQAVSQWRQSGYKAPIILMAGTCDASFPWRKLGVNDCIQKPFHLADLFRCIRKQLHEHENGEGAFLKIGSFFFNPYQKILTNGEGVQIHLTEKEALIIQYLHHVGESVSRQNLLQAVWGYNPNVTTHTLETHVYKLRQKIRNHFSTMEILLTENGGYRLLS